MKKHIFSPTKTHWLSLVLWPLLIRIFFAATPIPFVYYVLPSDRWAELAVGISLASSFAILALIPQAFRIWRTAIYVDDRGIYGRVAGKKLPSRLWSNIIAAWLEKDAYGERSLLLGTSKGILSIQLQLVEGLALWDALTPHLDPRALLEESRERLPDYVALQRQRQDLEAVVMNQPLRVIYKGEPRWGWVLSIFCLGLSIWAFIGAEPLAGLGFLGFSIVVASLIFEHGSIEMNNEGIVFKRPFRRYKIGWDEVQRIKMPKVKKRVYLFIGTHKRLRIPGPEQWSGEHVPLMKFWLDMQLKAHEIKAEDALFLDYAWSRNVRDSTNSNGQTK